MCDRRCDAFNKSNTSVKLNSDRAMKTKTLVLALIAVGAILFFVYVLNRDDSVDHDLEEVTIAQFGDLLLYAPLYLAQSEGIFREHGLNVTIVSTGGDDKTYAAVASGTAQFGIADPTFVAIAGERGQEGKVIGLLINGNPNYGVSLSPETPLIDTPADLAGRTVATAPAPSTSYALVEKMYESAGLSPSIHQVAPPGLVPALRAGSADYALLIEPWVSQVLSEGGRIGFSLNDYYPEFALTGITASDETLAEMPEIAEALLSALTVAIEVFYADEETALRAARLRFPDESVEILRSALGRLRQGRIYPECLVMREPAWEAAIGLRIAIGDLTGPLQSGQYVDNSFAKHSCPPEQ